MYDAENVACKFSRLRRHLKSKAKGGFPLMAEITRRQFFQEKFGAKTMAAIIT